MRQKRYKMNVMDDIAFKLHKYLISLGIENAYSFNEYGFIDIYANADLKNIKVDRVNPNLIWFSAFLHDYTTPYIVTFRLML